MNEIKVNPGVNPNSEASFLLKQEELLDRAKKGDKAALLELQRSSKESASEEQSPDQPAPPKLESENSAVSPELKPNAEGVSEALKAETNEMSQQMLNDIISGNVDITNPKSVTEALMRMGRNNAEKNRN